MNSTPRLQITLKERIVHGLYMPHLHLLLFIVLGLVLYLFTLPYPFVFDSNALIVNNPLIKSINSYKDLLDINNFVPEYLPRLNNPDMVTTFALRPFSYLTFSLNYLLGGLNPAGYRALNIAIHIANTILLYRFLSIIIRLRSKDCAEQIHLTIPFFTALLFLVHPLQTESVTYIIQRFTSLGVFFYLATMFLYFKSLTSMSAFLKRLTFLASIITLLLGLLSKEFLITAPVSLLMVELIILRNPIKQISKRLAPHFACMPILPVVLLLLSQDLNGGDMSARAAATISNFNAYSQMEYAITQLRVILSYFRLLALPYNLNFDPDYVLFRNFVHPEILVSILVWSVFLIAAIRLLKRKDRDLMSDLIAFSILWFPLLLCISSLLFPLPDLMFEHHAYLPSIAFCLGMITHLHVLQRQFSPYWSRRIFEGLCVVCVVFCVLTVQRNKVYKSRLSLWSDTTAKSPNKARPALALSNAYYDLRQDDHAIVWCEKAVALNPDYLDAYLSLGRNYQNTGRNHEAIVLYETYLDSHGPRRRILSNLAIAYSDVGMMNESISALIDAIKYDPDDEILHLDMAESLIETGRYAEARKYLTVASELDKNNPLIDISNDIRILKYSSGNRNSTSQPHRGQVKT